MESEGENELAFQRNHNALDRVDLDDSVSSDTADSEIERIQTNSPDASLHGTCTPGDRGLARTRKEEDIILRTIETAKALGSNTLDLCNKGLRLLPEEVFELQHLEVDL